jgi:hypothetical protein
MGKATGNPELLAIFLAKLDSNVPSKGWTTDTNVDCDIEHAPPQNRNEFSLRRWILQMQATEHSITRA